MRLSMVLTTFKGNSHVALIYEVAINLPPECDVCPFNCNGMFKLMTEYN